MKKLTLLSILAFVLFAFAVSAQNASIERCLNIRSASSPSLSADGSEITELTNSAQFRRNFGRHLEAQKPFGFISASYRFFGQTYEVK
jgi:hypothetical protein